MKKVLIAIIVIAVLGLLVFLTLNADRGDQGVEVDTEALERRALTEVVKASGVIDARVKVDLSAHVVARIDSIYVQEGDEVRAGQPFLELEKEAFIAARDSWRAQVSQARIGLRQAQIDLEDAQVKQQRTRRLADEGILSSEDREAADLRVASSELRLDERREALRQAEANLAKALDDFGRTTLYAPIAGRVTELNAEAGEVVVSGTMNNPASKIATIADLSEILAEVDVDENEIVDVELGQSVDLHVDAVSGRTYTGRVVEVGSSGYTRAQQPDVTFFRVKVLLEDPDERLRPGMSVRAEVLVAERESTLVAPIQAVVERDPLVEGTETGAAGESEKVVFVVEDGIAHQRPVETGLSDITHVEITAGAAEGDALVVGPFRTLRDLEDGDAVRVSTGDREDDDEDDDEDEDDEDA